MSQDPPNQKNSATSFVLDNSVMCGWFLANQSSDYGDAIARQLSQVDAGAGTLILLDTNICILIINARPPVVLQRFRDYRRGEIGICCVVAIG